MQHANYAPATRPTAIDEQQALQKGLGRAMLWAKKGLLTDAPLLDACLHDKRYDIQCEDNRGGWLWDILNEAGVAERFRQPILDALRHVSIEWDAYQLCQLALHYAQAGECSFRETPCENCRYDAFRLLLEAQVAPAWMTEECRFDSNEQCRELASQP